MPTIATEDCWELDIMERLVAAFERCLGVGKDWDGSSSVARRRATKDAIEKGERERRE
jgi:hypothetical protein